MSDQLYSEFISKLEEKYGNWEKGTSKFGDSSFGVIADELCISKSQFTMLISNKGSEGMYIRSIRNVNQLIKYNQYVHDLEELKKKQSSFKILKIVGVISLLFLTGFFIKKLMNSSQTKVSEMPISVHPLSNYFDGDPKSNYVSPYLPETEVQNYCPCSGYEGIWKLDKEYIIPLPSKKPGLYYVAKSSDIRFKCQKGVDSTKRGKILIGFENMHNEIWVDKKRNPFSPKYFNQETKNYTTEFLNLSLTSSPDFVKVCDIYSCFYDQFDIQDELIIRNGEPCGRYAKNIDQKIADKYEIDIEHILKNIISSMVKIECLPAINNYCDPNTLQENESLLEYECMFKIKTENLGIGGGYPYKKSYRLVEQNYADNLLCNCNK